MGFLNRFLTYCLYILGIRKRPEIPATPLADPREDPLIGTQGLIEADVLLLVQNDHVVVVVDHEFLDIPAWIEWDITRRSIGVAQSSGAVAELRTLVPPDVKKMFERVRTILLMTRFNGTKVAHRLSLIVRE